MSTPTTPEPRDDRSRPVGDPRRVAPNGGAPAVTADAIAKRDADRAAHAARSERRASRF